MPGRARTWLRWLAVVLLAAAAVSMGKAVSNALRPDRSDDFQWDAVSRLVQGENPYRVFLDAPDRPRVTTATANNPPPNYPITGFVFLIPYGLLDWSAAKVAWAATNLGCAIFIVIALARLAGPAGSVARLWGVVAGCLMLCSAPARDQISAGQHTLFSLACLLGAWMAGEKPSLRRWLSPMLIAAAWLKFSVTVPLTLIFLIRGRWREAAGALAIHVGLLGLLCGWLRTGPLDLVGQFIDTTRIGLFGLGLYSNVWDTLAIGRALGPEWPVMGPAISLVCLMAAAVVAWRVGRTGDPLAALGLLAIPACLVGFHFRYDFVVLALPLAWVLSRPLPRIDHAAVGSVALANWFGARWIEKLFYQSAGGPYGNWDTAGIVGIGVISGFTWLVMAWWLARVATRPSFLGEASEVRPASHHMLSRRVGRRHVQRADARDRRG
ncbi:MAG: DUF2029 domain-containing protein [Verrucomicrobiales bacterium]|nr:DUF2029 domain-containing protein [Verrucomicrobiales bacterium]